MKVAGENGCVTSRFNEVLRRRSKIWETEVQRGRSGTKWSGEVQEPGPIVTLFWFLIILNIFLTVIEIGINNISVIKKIKKQANGYHFRHCGSPEHAKYPYIQNGIGAKIAETM